ncbi:MAG: SPOR domain-containing protein [Pseudomonadota bacterium]
MKRFVITLALAGLLISNPLSLWNPGENLWALDPARFDLQVASLPTEISARKEIEHLKSYNLQAQMFPWEDRSRKTWFVIYILGYQTKEEAARHGNELIQNGIIRNFRVSLHKSKETAPVKVEKPPLPSPIPPKKEPKPLPGNSPVYIGPIFSEETKEEKPTLVKESPPPPSIPFRLQIASCPTQAAAQKELKRLKSHSIKAKQLLREDPSKKKWFIIYLDGFKDREEAKRKGNQLIQKKIIKTFQIFTPKPNGEIPSSKVKEAPPAPTTPSKKELPPSSEKNPLSFGPISIKEEETALRINIALDRKIFPEITADKIAEGSRLVVTFKNIDRYIVPIEFDKVQSPTLLSFSLAKKGSDCTFILLLNSSFNYEVAQKYFEKEKIYSLVVGREPAKGPGPVKKE